MRSSYRAHLWRLVRRGQFTPLLRAAKTALRIKRGTALEAPLFVTMALTYRCNYRCEMCDFPERATHQFLSAQKIIDVLRRLASQGTVAVGFTGGEPTLRKDLVSIIEQAKKLGLIVHLNTNGSALPSPRARALFESGLDSINISLDGALATTHDKLRGVQGSFSTIVETTARLVTLRQERNESTKIRLVMALGPENIDELEAMAKLSIRLGVDGLGFLPLHPLPGTPRPQYDETALHRFEQVLDALRQSPSGSILENSPLYLSGIPPFLRGEKTTHVCSAPDSHVAIDPWLRLYPCVPMMTHEIGSFSNATEGWSAAEAREQVDPSICENCWWNCHRELDIALRKIRNPF